MTGLREVGAGGGWRLCAGIAAASCAKNYRNPFCADAERGNACPRDGRNCVFGFVYWWVTARFFTPAAVGLASADISLMGFLGLAADIGLGTMLQGEIPKRRQLAPHLIWAALLASLLSAGILGLGYLASTAAFAPMGFRGLLHSTPSPRRRCVQTATLSWTRRWSEC